MCGAFSLTSTQKIPRLLRFFTHFYTTLKLSALLSPLITQLNSPIGKIFLSLSTLIAEKFEVSPDGIAMFTKPLWDVINSVPVTRT